MFFPVIGASNLPLCSQSVYISGPVGKFCLAFKCSFLFSPISYTTIKLLVSLIYTSLILIFPFFLFTIIPFPILPLLLTSSIFSLREYIRLYAPCMDAKGLKFVPFEGVLSSIYITGMVLTGSRLSAASSINKCTGMDGVLFRVTTRWPRTAFFLLVVPKKRPMQVDCG